MIKKYEGYWALTNGVVEGSVNKMPWEENYPWPESRTTKCNYELITRLKNIFIKAPQESYFGFSKCRFCHKENGCSEYLLIKENIKYIVPDGYLHYLEEHNVHPSEEFLQFIDQYY